MQRANQKNKTNKQRDKLKSKLERQQNIRNIRLDSKNNQTKNKSILC